jgi:hypothetical protein
MGGHRCLTGRDVIDDDDASGRRDDHCRRPTPERGAAMDHRGPSGEPQSDADARTTVEMRTVVARVEEIEASPLQEHAAGYSALVEQLRARLENADGVR